MKKLCEMICFCLLLGLIMQKIDKVLVLKTDDGIYNMMNFYKQEKDTIDVLIMGSSHAFIDVDTGVLWDKYGIASYTLGGPIQPLWNTYYFFKEALKTQTPELLVLEAYCATTDSDYVIESIPGSTYGMRWSENKLDAIKVSAPKEEWTDYILSYIQYHTRYKELSAEDFLPEKGQTRYKHWKGFYNLMKTEPFETPMVSHVTERSALNKKTEEYYRKIIELALDYEIPVLVIVSPYAAITDENQAVFNTASDIASEYGVDFINYNLLYDEVGIDFSCDVADWGHLNYRGAQKYALALGRYISDHFDVSDRRSDKRYWSWDEEAQYLSAAIENQELVETNLLDDIVGKIKSSNYTLFVSVDGNCTTADDNLAVLFDSLGIPRMGDNGFWQVSNLETEICTNRIGGSKRYMCLDSHDLCISRKYDADSQTYFNSIVMDGVEYRKVANGVNILVYSTATKSVADAFGVDMDNAYNLTRDDLKQGDKDCG